MEDIVAAGPIDLARGAVRVTIFSISSPSNNAERPPALGSELVSSKND
jgi:hypothetical protein